MKKTNTRFRLLTMLTAVVLGVCSVATPVLAATSAPDDLVNTESFFTLEDGDGTTDVELQFGSDAAARILTYSLSNARFEFGDDVHVTGDLEATNDVNVGNNVNVDGSATLDADGTGGELYFGTTAESLIWDNANSTFVFSDDLNVDGELSQDGNDFILDSDNAGVGADVTITANQGSDNDGILRYNATTNEWEISNDGGTSYSIATSNDIGNITGTDSNSFTLDVDDTGGNVTLQFGNTLAESLVWNNTLGRFELSDDLYLDGGLEVNGVIDFNQNEADELVFDQGTAFPTVPAPIEGQTFYRTDQNTFYIYDGASWVSLADSAGQYSVYLSPQYPHSSYYADGGTNTGRLTYYYDNTTADNVYRWETSKAAIQDYDVKVRIQVPEGFNGWDATTPIEFRYRTDTTTAGDNQLDFTMLDTADAAVTLANNTGLVSSAAGTWVDSTNMTIGGSPTWTIGDWITVSLKLSATNSGGAEAGFIVLNYDTTN